MYTPEIIINAFIYFMYVYMLFIVYINVIFIYSIKVHKRKPSYIIPLL